MVAEEKWQSVPMCDILRYKAKLIRVLSDGEEVSGRLMGVSWEGSVDRMYLRLMDREGFLNAFVDSNGVFEYRV